MSNKSRTMTIMGESITIAKDDYISLTDMLKTKDGDFFISDWLRNRNTVEYLGIWERIHNIDFNYGEFATIKSQAGLNSYKISVKEWVNKSRKSSAMISHTRMRFNIRVWLICLYGSEHYEDTLLSYLYDRRLILA